jgi:hypothetical protein
MRTISARLLFARRTLREPSVFATVWANNPFVLPVVRSFSVRSLSISSAWTSSTYSYRASFCSAVSSLMRPIIPRHCGGGFLFRLRAEGGAHGALKDAPQGNKINAAAAAISFEKPK